MSQATEQFWAGDFGNEYLARNQIDWKPRVAFFRHLHNLTKMCSILEVGCNAGHNLKAIYESQKNIELAGCDINKTAIKQARALLPHADIDECPANKLVSFYKDWGFDVVMTAGVLIHIPPEEVRKVMLAIVATAYEYVVAIEYDAIQEQEIKYRGHEGRLWKRPYGSMYAEFGLKTIYTAELGPEQGFGEGCTAWVMRK